MCVEVTMSVKRIVTEPPGRGAAAAPGFLFAQKSADGPQGERHVSADPGERRVSFQQLQPRVGEAGREIHGSTERRHFTSAQQRTGTRTRGTCGVTSPS